MTKREKWILFVAVFLGLCGTALGVAIIGYQDIQVISGAPSNPGSGYMRLYASGSQLGCLTSGGANCLSGAGPTIPSSCSLVYSSGTPALLCQTAKGLASVAYAAGGGSANAQTVTYSPAVASQSDITGYPVCWLPTAGNTSTTPTLNVNSLGANTITKLGHTALASGDLTTTAVACAIWDGTDYQLQNPQTSSGGFSNPMTTLGDLIVAGSGGTPNRLGVGTNNYCLVANSSATYGVNWAACPGGSYSGPSTQSVVTGSRALNSSSTSPSSVYHNTTGNPMWVMVSVYQGAAVTTQLSTVAYTDSSSTPTTAVGAAQNVTTTQYEYQNLTFLVMPGNYYFIYCPVISGGSPTLAYWTEWH